MEARTQGTSKERVSGKLPCFGKTRNLHRVGSVLIVQVLKTLLKCSYYGSDCENTLLLVQLLLRICFTVKKEKCLLWLCASPRHQCIKCLLISPHLLRSVSGIGVGAALDVSTQYLMCLAHVLLLFLLNHEQMTARQWQAVDTLKSVYTLRVQLGFQCLFKGQAEDDFL